MNKKLEKSVYIISGPVEFELKRGEVVSIGKKIVVGEKIFVPEGKRIPLEVSIESEIELNKEVDIVSRYESLNKNNVIGDFKFVVIEKFLSNENELPFYEKVILKAYFMLKYFSLSEERAFGLDTSNVLVEKFPMVIAPVKDIPLCRVN